MSPVIYWVIFLSGKKLTSYKDNNALVWYGTDGATTARPYEILAYHVLCTVLHHSRLSSNPKPVYYKRGVHLATTCKAVGQEVPSNRRSWSGHLKVANQFLRERSGIFLQIGSLLECYTYCTTLSYSLQSSHLGLWSLQEEGCSTLGRNHQVQSAYQMSALEQLELQKLLMAWGPMLLFLQVHSVENDILLRTDTQMCCNCRPQNRKWWLQFASLVSL